MAKIQLLTDVAEWQALWERARAEGSERFLIFKLSPICPTSHFVERIFNNFVAALPENPNLHIYSVDVIGARPVSQRIAADTKIPHESPQALLIKGGQRIAWHASHGDVDSDALKQYVVSK